MIDYGKVHWRAIHEYLLSIESAPTMDEFLARAVSGVGRLIPSDVGVGIHDFSRRFLHGTGIRASAQSAFNDYFRFRIPFVTDPRLFKEISLSLMGDNNCFVVDWNDYRDSEFVTDFARPEGEAYNLTCAIPGTHIMISLHRSSRDSVFSETHCSTLAVLSPHVSDLYSCFKKLEQSAAFAVTEDGIREHFQRISRREAEVAILLCRGLTAGEIASKLFISRRTVEAHIKHLYQKLDVRSKGEAVAVLTGGRK